MTLIAVVAAFLLVACFVYAADESYLTKGVVAGLLLVSMLLPWPLAELLLKAGLAIGLLMYFKVK